MKYAHTIVMAIAAGACAICAVLATLLGERASIVGFTVLTVGMGAMAAVTWPGRDDE